MNTYYKAVREDGLDFHTRTVDYGKAFKSKSQTLDHPRGATDQTSDASRYFSIATVATDCTGFSWPCRLFEVEPVGDAWTPHVSTMPNKRAARGVKLVRELPAWQVFGPDGEHIVAIINQFAALTFEQRRALAAARPDSFWDVEYAVASDGRSDRAGLRAARHALRGRLSDRGAGAAYGAALAVLIRSHVADGTFTQNEYDTLSQAWRRTIGLIHPDDAAVS